MLVVDILKFICTYGGRFQDVGFGWGNGLSMLYLESWGTLGRA